MRHAYYIAKTGLIVGDEDLAKDLKEIYDNLFSLSGMKEPDHYDGASRYTIEGNITTVVIINKKVIGV